MDFDEIFREKEAARAKALEDAAKAPAIAQERANGFHRRVSDDLLAALKTIADNDKGLGPPQLVPITGKLGNFERYERIVQIECNGSFRCVLKARVWCELGASEAVCSNIAVIGVRNNITRESSYTPTTGAPNTTGVPESHFFVNVQELWQTIRALVRSL